MNTGSELGVGRVGSQLLKRNHHHIDALLLSVKTNNCDGQQGAGGKYD